MARAQHYRFGPGALEMIELAVWTVSTDHETGRRRLAARATGSYDVYCGSGHEHRVRIDQRIEHFVRTSAQPVHDPCAVDAESIAHARDGDANAAWVLAHDLVELVLWDWSDPCADADIDELEYA